MLNRAPSLGRLTLAFLCLAGLVGLFVLLRCQKTEVAGPKPTVAAQKGEMAHLVMINRSPCEWQIVITSVEGGRRQVWKLSVDQTLDANLAGGVYSVEQMMLTDDAGPEAKRHFSMQLETGQFYRWQLVTLLSEAADDVHVPAQRKVGHE